MQYYGDVDFESTMKSELCEIRVLGTENETIKADLVIVEKNGKYGLIQAEHDENWFEEGVCFCEYILYCEYEEIDFLKTAVGTGVLIRKDGKIGFYTFSASSGNQNSHIFCEEMFPCVYDEISYTGGYPAYFRLFEGNQVTRYNFMTKEMTLEMRQEYD